MFQIESLSGISRDNTMIDKLMYTPDIQHYWLKILLKTWDIASFYEPKPNVPKVLKQTNEKTYLYNLWSTVLSLHESLRVKKITDWFLEAYQLYI